MGEYYHMYIFLREEKQTAFILTTGAVRLSLGKHGKTTKI